MNSNVPGIVTIGCALYVAYVFAFILLPPVGREIYYLGVDIASTPRPSGYDVSSLELCP